jgi:hypothetical protein
MVTAVARGSPNAGLTLPWTDGRSSSRPYCVNASPSIDGDGIPVNSPHQSDADFRVLHTLRCIGVATEERVATAAGTSRHETAARLRDLSGRGLVALAPGPFGGWGLTDDGRTTEQELLCVELELTDATDQVRECYQLFKELNPKLLQVCSDWQMRRLGQSHLLNDHRDADYDAKVLSRLMRIDDAAQRICDELANRLSRFEVYRRRLSSALERALTGDNAYVADSLESYHSVWFQLHEDLLVTLGISRDEERRDTTAAS